MPSHYQEGDLQIGQDGRWRMFHKMIGSGHQGQWVYSEPIDNWLRGLGAYRVEGSGLDMKLYSRPLPGEGGGDIVLSMRDPGGQQAYSQLYQRHIQGTGQDMAVAAGEQAAGVDLRAIWKDVYPEIDFPSLFITHPTTGIATPGTTDVNRVSEIIRALEARVGDLSKYGINTNADYQVIPLGDQYKSDIVLSNGKVTKIDKTTAGKASYTPGLQTGIGADLKGYDVLQQRSGQLDPIKQRVDPGYIIDPQTMQPYFQQPDGSLQAAPIPSVDDQISMHLVEGNMDAAVNKANFRDRPSSLEYFNAAMKWARTPADIFTISAIVRGVIEPPPGPMGELRRVGAPPAWASQAWVGLQNSMGIPVESMTSGPGAEPGSVNEMMVASSSALVPNNFIAANSSATTLDGGKTVNPPPTANIMGDTTVQATRDGEVVGTMTADMANKQGYDFTGKGGETDFTTIVKPTGDKKTGDASTEITPKIPDDPRTGTSWNPAEFAAGGLDDRMNQIEAAGGILQADGSYLGPNGERWDAAGFLIETPSEPRDQFDIQAELQADPANAALIAEANALRDTIIEDDASQDPRVIQALIDAGLNPNTGLPYEYGTDPDDMFVESEADRAARIGSGATLPTTTVANRGNILDPMFGVGAQSATGPASSFADAIDSRPDTDFIDLSEEGGYGNEQAIYEDWRSGMRDKGYVDIPGEGFISKDYLSTPERWADVIASGQPDFSGPSSYQTASDKARLEALAWAKANPYGVVDPATGRYIPGTAPNIDAINATREGLPFSGSSRSRNVTGTDLQSASFPSWLQPSVQPTIVEPELDPWDAPGQPVDSSISGRMLQAKNFPTITTPSVTTGEANKRLDAAQPFDYAMEGGSVATDIALEKARQKEAEGAANRALAAKVAAEEARQREAILAAEADAANKFVRATQERDPIPTPYGTSYGGDDDYVPVYDALDYGGGDDYVPEMITVPSPAAIPTAAVMPTPSQIPDPVINVNPQPSGPEPYSEAAFWSDYGEGAKGTRTDDRFTLVGEEGPELALFPRGTEIIPLNRPTKPKQRRRLRNQFSDAIDSFAFGGFSSGGPALVGEMGPELVDLPPGAQVMPAGITEMMTGRPTRAPRSLFRQAGMRAPSAQTISNLLPEEISVYQEMGRLAGIPDKAFEREFRSMVPMGQGGTRQARFTPRSTGRTRYGSI